MEVDVSVCKHHTFWICAGAAGVEEFGESVLVNRADVRAMRRSRAEKGIVVNWSEPRSFRRTIQLDEHFHRVKILAKGFHQSEKLLLHEEDRRAGIIQNVGQLFRCEPDIQREQNSAGFQNAVVGLKQAVT